MNEIARPASQFALTFAPRRKFRRVDTRDPHIDPQFLIQPYPGPYRERVAINDPLATAAMGPGRRLSDELAKAF